MRMGKMSIAFFDAKEYDRQSFVISNEKSFFEQRRSKKFTEYVVT